MELIERLKVLNNNLKAQNFEYVINGCRKILKKDPENPYVYNLCGLALQGAKQISNSVEHFKRAISLQENNLPAMNNLANSYKALGKIDLAEELYNKVLNINPNYIQALNNYGNLKQILNDFDGAINLYLKALSLKKNEIGILFSLAGAYQGLGNLEKTKEITDKIFNIDPKNTSTHKLVSGFTNYKDDQSHLNKMKKIVEEKNLSANQLIDLSFALGKAYEDIGDFENSYKNLQVGNSLKKQKLNYQITKEEKLFQNLKKTFDEIDLNNDGNLSSNKKIIFICGMPRSGTTLVEQIIASHNEVQGAGELIYLQKAIEKNFLQQNKVIKQKLIEEINSDKNILEKEYLEMLNFHKYDSKITTDKAPQNFRWIGFIKLFFPNSKVIHCNRNPKDNCLSLFKNNFASKDMSWTYDQEDLAKYYNLYSDLMKFWSQKIPDFIYSANYEKIIEDQESEIKKLISFCGLDWDPSCLNHHKNKKTPIKTVSAVQARKPIYKSSLNSNTGYAEYLSKLFNSLNIK